MRKSILALAVVLSATRLAAATKSWTGAVNGLWSTPGNWSPAGAPTMDDDLVFSTETPNPQMTNDLPPGNAYGRITFGRGGYLINGNTIGLTRGIARVIGLSGLRIDAPLRLSGTQALSQEANPGELDLTLNGAVELNGTISMKRVRVNGAISGSGQLRLYNCSLFGPSTHSGTVVMETTPPGQTQSVFAGANHPMPWQGAPFTNLHA